MLSRALWQRPKTLIDRKAPSGWTFVRRWALLCSSTRAFSCLANSIPTASVAAILSLRERAPCFWSLFSIKMEQKAFFAPTRLTLADAFPASFWAHKPEQAFLRPSRASGKKRCMLDVFAASLSQKVTKKGPAGRTLPCFRRLPSSCQYSGYIPPVRQAEIRTHPNTLF